MAEKGSVTNKGVRTRDQYYLQIPNATKLKSRRLSLSNGLDAPHKGKWQVIKKVEKLEGKHNTYCLEETELHQCLFNNVITKQCNLSEINGKLVKSRQDFIYAATAASIIGTIQAGYTSFPYLGEVTERIVKRESLLGVSITGMMDSPDILFNPELQREAASMVAFTNRRIAEMIGINPAARATCIKPSGTASCLLGSASGIHAHHAKRYFRRVQANKMEACYQYFASVNGDACEDSVWSANNTDGVISFCVEAPEEAKTKAHIDAVTLLKYIKLTQQNWVKEGCEPRLCTQPWLSHNVSNTINVHPDEWEAVSKFIFENRNYFTAVSLLPASGDKDYQQAPFTAVYTSDELREIYGEECFNNMCVFYMETIELFGENKLWLTCNVLNNSVAAESIITNQEKKEWLRAAAGYAILFFNGDMKKLTYCLKDIHHWQQWIKLTNSYREVHYEDLIEEQDNTTPMDTVACAGGSCEIHF
jgi:ribonucleoside-diphosphate reductase alpha chain